MKKFVLVNILTILMIFCASCGKSNSSSGVISSSNFSSAVSSVETASAESKASSAGESALSEQSASSGNSSVQPKSSAPPAEEMRVACAGISGGVIADKYGKFGAQINNGIPTLSMPLTISNPPAGTAVYAVAMEDLSVSSNSVHWLAANITSASIPENASVTMKNNMVQGENCFGATGYGGPTPSKSTHKYSIKIYALSAALNLSEGYNHAEFTAQIEDKILVQKEITGTYRYK